MHRRATLLARPSTSAGAATDNVDLPPSGERRAATARPPITTSARTPKARTRRRHAPKAVPGRADVSRPAPRAATPPRAHARTAPCVRDRADGATLQRKKARPPRISLRLNGDDANPQPSDPTPPAPPRAPRHRALATRNNRRHRP